MTLNGVMALYTLRYFNEFAKLVTTFWSIELIDQKSASTISSTKFTHSRAGGGEFRMEFNLPFISDLYIIIIFIINCTRSTQELL